MGDISIAELCRRFVDATHTSLLDQRLPAPPAVRRAELLSWAQRAAAGLAQLLHAGEAAAPGGPLCSSFASLSAAMGAGEVGGGLYQERLNAVGLLWGGAACAADGRAGE